MRILHTSDWHLGQQFKGFDRQAEHRVFLDWLVETLADRRIDALLVAGDLFDQANPSADAQKLFFDFLAAARKRCPALDIVMIAGNHDSAGRIDAPHPLLSAFGVRVMGRHDARQELTPELLDRILVPVTNADGRTAAWVLAVPYLRPADLDLGSGQDYASAIGQVYAALGEAAAGQLDSDQALLVMGHLHARGGQVSEDSERRLVIGGEEAVGAELFPAQATYVALGHLHLPQAVTAEHIRYSGSPLPLSFSEIDYPHQVVEVELDGNAIDRIEPIRIPRPVELLRVPAVASPIEEAIRALEELEVEPQTPALQPLVEVQILASIVPTDMRARIEAAIDGKPLRLTGIQRSRPVRDEDSAKSAINTDTDLRELTPDRLFSRLLDEHSDLGERADLEDAFAQLLRATEEEETN